MKRIEHVLCTCGKEKYYSEEAARYVLDRLEQRKLLDASRKEQRVHPCGFEDGVWHLTSMDEATYLKVREAQEKIRKQQEALRREQIHRMVRAKVESRIRNGTLSPGTRRIVRKDMFAALRRFGVASDRQFVVPTENWGMHPKPERTFSGWAKIRFRTGRTTGRTIIIARVKTNRCKKRGPSDRFLRGR